MPRDRLFISGISGLLGLNAALHLRNRCEVAGCYLSHPVAVHGVDAIRLDVEDGAAVAALVRRLRPSVILHTAGLTNVDRCERDPELANRLNVDVTRNVSKAAREVDARLVHISTDHLFSGEHQFYPEGAEPQPVNAYARTKWAAERVLMELCPRALIVRTNFVGWGTSIRGSLTDWILRSLDAGAPFNMFTDVFITPILINDLLDCILELLVRNAAGVLNVAGVERLSKYELGLRTARVFGYPNDLIRATSIESCSLVAPRPRDMSLDISKVSALLGHPMPDANDALTRMRQLGERGWPAELERIVHGGAGVAPVAGARRPT